MIWNRYSMQIFRITTRTSTWIATRPASRTSPSCRRLPIEISTFPVSRIAPNSRKDNLWPRSSPDFFGLVHGIDSCWRHGGMSHPPFPDVLSCQNWLFSIQFSFFFDSFKHKQIQILFYLSQQLNNSNYSCYPCYILYSFRPDKYSSRRFFEFLIGFHGKHLIISFASSNIATTWVTDKKKFGLYPKSAALKIGNQSGTPTWVTGRVA